MKERNFLTGWLLCGTMVFCGLSPVSAEPTVYENGSSYEIVDGVLKITVPEGKTNDVASAELSSLLDNTATGVEKYGRGSLVMNVDLTAYTGDIRIKEGTWRVVDSKGLGKLSKNSQAEDVGKVYVSDGATLEAKCAESPRYGGKQIHVSGYGVDGNGALLVSGDIASYGSSTWGSNLILEGDTYANSITATYWYLNMAAYSNGGWITFNGHDFIVSGGTANNPFVVFSGVNNTDLGRVVATNNTVLSFQNGNNLARINDVAGTIVVNPGCRINGNKWYGRMEWDVIWNTASYLTPGAYSTSTAAADIPVTNKCSFHGGVEVAQTLNATISNGGGLGFLGPITGQGEINIANTSADVPPTNQVWIANGGNSFAGDIKCRNVCLMVPENGALPMTATLQLTDCLVNFAGRNYVLPDATFANTKDCVIAGGYGKWKTLVKTGAGTVDYDSGIGAGELELREGVMKVSVQPSTYAGLIEGVGYFDNANTSINAALNAEIAYTNGVVMSPYLMNSEMKTYWTTHRPDWDIEAQTIKGHCTTYTGYMWNRESTNVMWTFVSCVANRTVLHIDNEQVLYHTPNSNAKTLGTNTIEVAPGPHRFRIANHSSYHSNNPLRTEGGMSGSVPGWKGMGLRWDPLGRGTTNREDFVILEDPGDGSLFTWAIPGDDVFYPGTDENSKIGKFRRVKFTGGTLHLNGVTNTISEMEGFPNVAGTGKLIIENKWTIDAADIVDGSAVPGLSFGFGEDAEIEIENSSAAGSMADDREWTVIESSEDISGSVSVKNEATAKRWNVEVDGNKLKLKYIPLGTTVVIR